jgi:hypothetical protein
MTEKRYDQVLAVRGEGGIHAFVMNLEFGFLVEVFLLVVD